MFYVTYTPELIQHHRRLQLAQATYTTIKQPKPSEKVQVKPSPKSENQETAEGRPQRRS